MCICANCQESPNKLKGRNLQSSISRITKSGIGIFCFGQERFRRSRYKSDAAKAALRHG